MSKNRNLEKIINLIRKYRKKIGEIVSIASIFFVFIAIKKLGFHFENITNWKMFLGVFIIGVLAKCVTIVLSGISWSLWLSFFADKKIDIKEAVNVYARANIGKYLPGNVMHYVERNMFAANMGVNQKKIAMSSLLEVFCLIMGAICIAIVMAAEQLKGIFYKIMRVEYILWIIIIVLVLIIIIGLLKYYNIFDIRKLPKKKLLFTVLIAILLYSVVLIVLGEIMVLLYLYMGGKASIYNNSMIVAGYVIAWVLGFIIPGISGGLGVREVVIITLLGNIIGKDTIVMLTVTHRLITIVGDFMVYLLAMLFWRKQK